MPPKTHTEPTESRHFKITGFNPQPVRELLDEYTECTTEIAETEQLHEQLKSEVSQLQRKTKFTDKKQLEILSMKRLQLEMVPNKIAELEDRRTQLEGEMANVVTSAALGLAAAVRKLLSSELRRLEREMVAAIAPVLGCEKEALEVVKKSNRYIDVQNRVVCWSYAPSKAASIQAGLAILDRYNETGSLEKQPAKPESALAV